MSERLIDDCPKFQRYDVGDCEMLESPNGIWMRRIDIIELLDWIVDHDENEVMLKKVRHLKGAIA